MRFRNLNELAFREPLVAVRIVSLVFSMATILLLVFGCGNQETPPDSGMDGQDGDGGSGARIGEFCTESEDCESRFCKYGFFGPSMGLCTIPCDADSDCLDILDDGSPMCCVSQLGEPSFCEKIALGAECGSREGTCGTPCTDQQQSACGEGLFCDGDPQNPQAFCSHLCEDQSDCDDCRYPENATYGLPCIPVQGGRRMCLFID